MQHTYYIDQQPFSVEMQSREFFASGPEDILAQTYQDVTQGMPWYQQGYCVLESTDYFDALNVKQAVEARVEEIIRTNFPDIELRGFTLERYHKYINDQQHREVIAKTRRLYPADLAFDSEVFVQKLGAYMQTHLSYTNNLTHQKHWIIVRINRPGSVGYNPAHKDIYEAYDEHGAVPRMLNVWIPVCGVSDKTGLPVAAGSHLLPESKILRTRAGSELNQQKYSVNSILSWDDSTCLQTITPAPNQMMVFSSHLIHGLAKNHHPDQTRVSLEFRLYADS